MKNVGANGNFFKRKDDTDFYTEALVAYLESINHFKVAFKAEKEDDIEGIDYYVKYPKRNQVVPIQFKLRELASNKLDCPVSYKQPIQGVDLPESKLNKFGRDYLGVKNKVCKFYYWATAEAIEKAYVYSNINIITCSKLSGLLDTLDDNFQTYDAELGRFKPITSFTEEYINNSLYNVRHKMVFCDENGSEVWWKKWPSEKNGKLLAYIPNRFKMKSIKVDLKEAILMNANFQKLKEMT